MMDRSLEGRAIVPAGYRMIDSFSITNFRCFDSLRLSRLKRINLIVGDNATGKTTLLEAIRTARAGFPAVLPWLNSYRNLPYAPAAPITQETFEGIWDTYFPNLDKTKIITLRFVDSRRKATTTTIKFDFKSPVVATNIGGALRPIAPIVFERQMGKHTSIARALVNAQNQAVFDPPTSAPEMTGFFAASTPASQFDNARWFSHLSQRNEEQQVITALKEEFPFVKDVQVISPTGANAVIVVKTSYSDAKLPLTLVSDGLTRYFTLLLATITYAGEIVLFDEIESGLYHKRFRSIWRRLYELADRSQTQVFASTHSYECLTELLPTIQGHEHNFTMIRLERDERGKIAATQIEGAGIRGALESEGELR
jgi:hypothetical protein